MKEFLEVDIPDGFEVDEITEHHWKDRIEVVLKLKESE